MSGRRYYSLERTSSKNRSVFLAGSIDMVPGDDWRRDITDYFTNQGIDVYNPRWLDWNNSWKQGKDDGPFRERVLWELDHLEKCDHILMYFAPNSKSPISLLEFGLFKDKSIFVVCPAGFYRKGNVDIVCERYDIPVFGDMESFKRWFVRLDEYY